MKTINFTIRLLFRFYIEVSIRLPYLVVDELLSVRLARTPEIEFTVNDQELEEFAREQRREERRRWREGYYSPVEPNWLQRMWTERFR